MFLERKSSSFKRLGLGLALAFALAPAAALAASPDPHQSADLQCRDGRWKVDGFSGYSDCYAYYYAFYVEEYCNYDPSASYCN